MPEEYDPADPPVGPGTRVTLSFSLSLSTGEEIDSTRGNAVTFVVGDGNLLPGFEKAMFGLRAGDARSLDVPADQGFGQPNPDNIHMMKRSDFEKHLSLSEGLVVSFADAESNERPGMIKRLDGELVEVDFNHPLAGKDLRFDVVIKKVKQVSDEILRA